MYRLLLLALMLSAPASAIQSATGVVTGRLLAKDGTAAVGVRVSAVAAPTSGALAGVSALAALAETDSAGRYRLENLPTGRYLIAAGLIDSPTYFPGVTAATSATAIMVTASATTAEINFTMVIPAALSISGRVVWPPAVSLAAVRVAMIPLSPASLSPETTELKADGTFRFSKVRPGTYAFQILPTTAFSASGTVSVTVFDQDIEDVELKINATVPITAAAVVDGGGLVPRLSLTFAPFRGGQGAALIQLTGVDARQQIAEGEYRVAWSALPAGYYLKSITSGSTDVLANPLKVAAEGAPPRIVVTLGVTSPPPWVKVSGRVTGLPNNPTTAPFRLTLTAATATTAAVPEVPINADGSFQFPMVLPGAYTARVIPVPIMSPIPVIVPSRDLAGLQVAVPPLKPVTVRLTINGNGAAPAGLALRITDATAGVVSISGTAQPDGTFRVLTPEGSYRVSLTASGYTVQDLKYGTDDLMRQPLTVSAADRAELLATLMPSPVVAGRVLGGTSGGVLGGVLGGSLGGIVGVPPPPPTAPPPPPPPPPPASTTAPIRVGGDVLAANCLSCPQPVYPALAQAAGISDTVVLSAIVGKDGTVRDVTVIRGHQLLRQAAMDTVRQWRYKPQMLNGQAVEITASISLSFK